MPKTILLVDDEPKLRDVLSVALESLGYRVLAAASGSEALELVDSEDVALVLTDLRMPGMGGRELMSALKQRRLDLPVVIMTAYASVKDAVQIIREGAFDYIGKPFEMEELAVTLAAALRYFDAMRENQRLRQELEGRHSFESLIGDSPAFRLVIAAISEVCESRTNVLLTGESGTGKEMVARAIHFNSPRRDQPFIALNCAAIPDGLLESELFGHAKGAFTGAISNHVGYFARADGGTLFLDEVGDMPVGIQAKILRVIQERTFTPVGDQRSRSVDVRLLAATHRDLRSRIGTGEFREDLYYRLAVFPIHLPSLRERLEDIRPLANHFLSQFSLEMGKRLTGFTPAALQSMQAYGWPGNIRELQNCVERAVIVARGGVIDQVDLPPYLFQRTVKKAGDKVPSNLDSALEDLERKFILEALGQCGGVQVRAAALLGITERSLWHRVKRLGISVTKRIE